MQAQFLLLTGWVIESTAWHRNGHQMQTLDTHTKVTIALLYYIISKYRIK